MSNVNEGQDHGPVREIEGVLVKPRKRFRAMVWRASVVALALAVCSVTFGQQQLTPNYRDVDLRVLIEAVTAVTGRTFLVDPRVRAQVWLISNTPMSAEDFYQAFLATLAVNGYVAVEEGAVTKIVPEANARQLPGAGPGAEGEELVTQVVRVDNVAAAQLVPMLRPLQPQYSHMAALPGGNMLVIVDRASNLERLLDVIEAMDRQSDDEIEVIRLENAFAGEVVQTLSTMAQAAQAAGGAPGVQVIPDERTNSVLLSGSESGRLRYRGLIAYLDAPVQGGGDTRVRYLNNADAEELATALQAQYGGAAPTPAEGVAPADQGPVNIWAHPATNALVINAPSRVMQDMMAVIDLIDIPRAQVLVNAIIVELTEEKAAQLGVTWVADGSGGDSVIGVTNFGSTIPGVAQLGAVAQGDTPSAAAIPEGLTLGLGRIRDAGTSWAALVSALRGDGQANIISEPQVTVLDNEEAEISVGQEVPFVTGQYASTTTEGAVNPFSTVTREPVGTTLRIVPQINEGSGMQLTIYQEQSSISPGASGAVDLVTNQRSITTTVFAQNGEILVLGGLIDDQLRQSEQRVPGLGRIPGLGWLFRARSTERVKTNLMVFIQPIILRDSVQAYFETNRKYNFLREMQRQQAQEPVRLMREENYPILPEIPPAQQLQPLPPPQQPQPAPETGAETDIPEDGNGP